MSVLKQGSLFANRYFLVQYIGAGGYSEVWLAQDTKAGDMQIALKVFAPEKGLDEKGLKIFSKEYSLVFNLYHPGLLRPSHFDEHNGSPYLVMLYCKNGSALDKIGEMSENELAVFMQQAASALAYLHEQTPPIIHQDIKPDNFLIDNKGNFLLADFGISSQIRRTLTKSMGDRSSAGTLAYMPPEKFSADKRIISEGDIFSLGATMYEFLTGDLPFGSHGGMVLLSGAQIPNLPGELPKALNEILRRCMDIDPAKRPTARELESIATNYLRTGQWQAMPSAEKEAERKPEPIPVRKGQETQEMPVNKIPKPPITNDIDNTDSAADDGKPGFPPQKSRRPWLRWIIILAVLGIIAGIVTIVALNSSPTDEEMAARDKAKQDSIAEVQLAYDDSMRYVAIADSVAQIEAQSKKTGTANPVGETPVAKTTDKSVSIFGTFTDPHDGKTYKTVKIGNQVWMAENLNYVTNSGSWCYDNSSSNCSKYGRLYTWEAAKKACPPGWHLPSKSEFETLLNKFGGGGTNAYNALKKGGSSGFSALLGGWRSYKGIFGYIEINDFWWSSSEYNTDHAWCLNMYSFTQNANMSYGSKEMGISVRCLQD
ncbi:MAG TPA: FISUMP domain-containing protein [Bacteroidales bacterium]|nr:protein kinase [Bacteroidales bacterium]HNW90515.1 FISUMP domain-containing protein [Bacteroidales bacterium]